MHVPRRAALDRHVSARPPLRVIVFALLVRNARSNAQEPILFALLVRNARLKSQKPVLSNFLVRNVRPK
jgi:hypothetical protein